MRRFSMLLACATSAFLAVTASASGTVISGPAYGSASAQLSGAQEVPPADPDGFGRISVRLDVAKDQVCYGLHVRNIESSTAAHIHRAPAGSNGPVVIDLEAPSAPSGASSGCASPRGTAPPDTIQDIIDHPEAYYVNVHNAPFPGGAVRGQLG